MKKKSNPNDVQGEYIDLDILREILDRLRVIDNTTRQNEVNLNEITKHVERIYQKITDIAK